MALRLKRLILGDPLHTEQAVHQRLSNSVALAVFSSDALSSTAYATGEIVLVLAIAGTAALSLTWPIAIAVGLLLVIVVSSYRQTIAAYPAGGGSYRVSKDNLGEFAGLVAGASLLVDYTLTVAVSVAAGTAALTSAVPDLSRYRVEIAVVFVVILAVANLRGVKESGLLFAVPTYGFVGLLGFTIVAGISRFIMLGPESIVVPQVEPIEAVAPLTAFVVLRAFASGCAAMTGVEAIADGVAVFREPTATNARKTITAMAGMLLFLFLGLSWLAVHAQVQPTEETVISQLSRQFFGTGPLYFAISAFTTAILVIAANTAYADFPRLASFMAADDFLPRQLRDLGHKLVFSNGILMLTAVAIGLIVAFGAQTTRLIPLYALGVFTSFTLSQAGMVRRSLRLKQGRWWQSVALNGIGALATVVVLVIVTVTKFTQGAWIVALLIPALVAYFTWVRRQYDRVKRELAIEPDELTDLNWQSYNRLHNHVIVLVKNVDRRLIRALQYAKSLKADRLEAVYVDIGGDYAEDLRKKWDLGQFGIRLRIIESPYRQILGPIMDYIRSIPRPTCDHVVTVILPEYVPEHLGDSLLHDQTSFWLKQQLFDEPGVILTDVPYQLDEPCALPKKELPKGPRPGLS